jgi:cytochrome c2
MSHLFAFLLFIRYVDEPGNAEQGERVLHRYRCDSCHAIGGQGGAVGPDLERWARFVNPIVWAQKMWDHAEEMEAQMASMGIGWPEFEPRDLVNIIAYIRSRGIGESKEYIEPGSPSRGKEIFGARGCETCHKIGGDRGGTIDLNEADLPETLAGIASRMWNHAPAMQRAMRRKSSPATSIEAQEMADVIAYVLTRRYYAGEGDPKRGAQVFEAKGCSTCHALGEGGGGVGPDLSSVRGNASPVFMAYVMWRWGPTMTAEMTRQGLPWPSFSDDEMTDLIAFFDQPRDSTKED